MTQSFDEWYKDARDITAKAGWEAGAQSKQAEIDEYKEVSSSMEDAYLREKAKVEELQKRIDLIVDLVRDNTPDYWLDNMIQDILKGTTNEQ